MSLENRRKRLIFRSGHRGTKEMDIIMESFAVQSVPSFSEEELDQYESILEQNDPDLYNWITGQEIAPDALVSLKVFQSLLNHRISVG